jgi:hypothetical protein
VEDLSLRAKEKNFQGREVTGRGQKTLNISTYESILTSIEAMTRQITVKTRKRTKRKSSKSAWTD